jgi:hypothetical protein
MNTLAMVLWMALAVEPGAALSTVSGHGGLTASLDESGALAVLRWPGPGGPDQMSNRGTEIRMGPATVAPGGGRWGLAVGERWFWFGDPDAQMRQTYASPTSGTMVTEVTWPEAGVSARQRAGVLPGRDVFVSVIEIRGAAAVPRIVWAADFAPTTRHIPEIPLGDGALDAFNDFAAFIDRDGGRVWHFRPNRPGKDEWSRARARATESALPAAWALFGSGVWIGITGAQPVHSARVGTRGSDLERAGLAAVGDTVSVFEPKVEVEDGTYRAWIAIGLGATYDGAVKSLEGAEAAAARFGDTIGAPADLPAVVAALPEEFLGIAARHWLTLTALRDPASGLTVRGLSADPPVARDWPRDGAIAAWALHLAGQDGVAEKAVETYFADVRRDDRPRRPLGSMPESIFTNGDPASPHFIVDDRGPARVLWVADRTIQDRSGEARAAWVRKHWKVIEAAAEFLSTWMEPRRGAPLWSADPIGLADAGTQDRVFAAYGGISAALRLAAYAGKPAPESWTARRAQLRAMTEWILTEPGKWRNEDALLLEVEGFSDEVLRRVMEDCSKRLENPIGLDRRQLSRLLLQTALLGRKAAGMGPAPTDAGFRRGLQRLDGEGDLAVPTPDSLVSAEILIAMLLRGVV